MTTIAKPFRNKENYAKYLALYFEPGLSVLLTTLEWCYKGQRPIEEHLADLGATKSLRKTNTINDTEQNTLEELKEGKTKLNDLDITLIYKIIQLTCKLLPRYDKPWTKNCPKSRQGELEFLLFQLKDGRNKLAHPHDEHKNITDQMVEKKCKNMKDLLMKLLQAAALRGNIDLNSSEFNKVNKHIDDDVQRILKGENVCDSMSDHTLGLILADLKTKSSHNEELKPSFIKELGEYSAPLLKNKGVSQFFKDILQLNKSPVIVVQGEAGMGKTTMSRFLFNSWLSGNTDPVEGLSSFEVVIGVECNQITTRDISQFYETLLPGASLAFPNTVSLKKSLDKFKVFWIMDGFDESTAEFKGFLTAMVNTLSEKHKLLITTRPNTYYAELNDILSKCKLSITSLTLELLQDHNVEEIIKSLIFDDEQKENFKTHYISMDETSKHLLRTPLNLNLYINLWMLNPEIVRDTYTTKLLYLKTIGNNLSLLPERLDGHTCLTSEELKDSLKDWFFGSLCKQSFLMLMQNRFNLISKNDLKALKKGARKFTQNTSMCLSTFLVQRKKYYWGWEEKEEFRYKFHHLTQQYILAFLFLKHFKDYDGENVIKSIYNELCKFGRFTCLNSVMKFYVEMIKEDGSMDKDSTQVFSTLQSIINSTANIKYRSKLWFSSSVALNFNVKYMEKVSQAFKDIPHVYVAGNFSNFKNSLGLNFIKFLQFVGPQKIILANRSLAYIQEEGFQPLLEFLIKSQLEIEFRTLDYYSPFFVTDDAFCGTFDIFLKHREKQKKWTEELETICLRGEFDSEFYQFYFETLNELTTLERLEIWINFDSFWLPTNIKKLKKEMIKITTIGLTSLNNDNFEMVLVKLNKIKGKGSLKFIALHHDFEDISETDKWRLQQMAHKVSVDFICQCQKYYIEKMVKLNITSFAGDIQLLNALNSCHANLKSVCLFIKYKGEFFRTLKFLRAYKVNLNEVKIYIYDNFLESDYLEIRTSSNVFSKFLTWIRTYFDENRTSANVFTIPQELVQRTTICMSEINQYNFDGYFMFLNNLKSDETLKFKAVYTHHRSLNHYQLTKLNQITGNSSCFNDIDLN